MPTYKWQPPYNMLLGLRWQHWAVPVMCLANTKTKPVRNPSWKLQYRELTNWRWVNWQTGGGTKSALALFWIDLRKFCQANIHPCIPLNPNMCDMWGGTSHIFSARSLWKKIIRSGGVRSSNWLSSQLENLTRCEPLIPLPAMVLPGGKNQADKLHIAS